MAKISGILTDGAGQIINDCTIELYAKKTTINVLTQTQAFTVASNGRYSMNVSPCEYDVSLIINGFPKKRLGSINVYSDSRNGSLNDFLINPSETDVTPEFIKQVIDARNEAREWASAIEPSTLVRYCGDLADTHISNLGAMSKGIYYQPQNAKAKLEFGYPVTEAGSLIVLPTLTEGNQSCVQIYTLYKSGRQFIRNYRGSNTSGFWENWIEQITTANIHEFVPIGEFRLMPFRAGELPFGWYFRNGDNYFLSSPQGQVLNRLSDNYKRDHQITIKNINGQYYINVPSAFAPDGRGFFERPANGTTRQIGSWEDDAIREIWGHFDTGVVDNHVGYAKGAFAGAYAINPKGGAFQPTRDLDAWGYEFFASRVVPTANENRPLNIGLTPAIYLGV
ncbi:hypothetical protein FPQ14_00870 [Gilliamella apicola]|uniref:Lambda-like tail fibre protein N-terminal domain-containing protein n=1 Tax=Gilliamella apicola TaxID=1196095 RepID=A0A556RSH7_9GAMM|nr:prophage tail fiber N-terminal domain-containing protein [Gilliamella apicola]TSJ91850.1 hypothetical protein FPQ14_00870 [Gilliamella apicola]